MTGEERYWAQQNRKVGRVYCFLTEEQAAFLRASLEERKTFPNRKAILELPTRRRGGSAKAMSSATTSTHLSWAPFTGSTADVKRKTFGALRSALGQVVSKASRIFRRSCRWRMPSYSERLSVRGRFKRQPHIKLRAIGTRGEVDFSVMPFDDDPVADNQAESRA